MDKWQDTRELLRRAMRIYVEPYVRDLFVRIIPGLYLILGIVVVKYGLTFALDLTEAFLSWIVAVLVVMAAAIVGVLLLKVGHAIRYALPIQPPGWPKHLWLEAAEDFDDKTPLRLRRLASTFETLAQMAVGLGTASVILLLVAIFRLNSYWGWTVLVLLAVLVLVRALHRVLGPTGTTIGTAVVAILLIAALFRLGSLTVTVLLLAALALRIVHSIFRGKWHTIIRKVIPVPAAVDRKPRLTPGYLGPQGATAEDEAYAGSSYAAVRELMLENPYYATWGDGQNFRGENAESLPVYRVTLESVLRGILPFGERFQFRDAARRTVDTRGDVRTGLGGRGYRRLLHPNGVCLFGEWEITVPNGYSGYFQHQSKALLIGRYSTCCTEVRSGRRRSLSLVGKLYPTTNSESREPLRTANFITQEDLGGETHEFINDAVFRNAPDTTAWRRGLGPNGLPVISITGILFNLVDKVSAIRQLHQIAELGKPNDQPTRAPKFMRILMDENQPRIRAEDFRDEVLGQIYDHGVETPMRKLVFHIEVSDEGETKGSPVFQRLTIANWRRIGTLTFTEGVASYNADHLIHFSHPKWRDDRNDPATTIRRNGTRVR